MNTRNMTLISSKYDTIGITSFEETNKLTLTLGRQKFGRIKANNHDLNAANTGARLDSSLQK